MSGLGADRGRDPARRHGPAAIGRFGADPYQRRLGHQQQPRPRPGRPNQKSTKVSSIEVEVVKWKDFGGAMKMALVSRVVKEWQLGNLFAIRWYRK